MQLCTNYEIELYKMISSSKVEADYEGKTSEGITLKAAASSILSTTSTSWPRSFKDPRIVRVSRAFGGKDRHSKVCTVRGLRDRRVRLSVPTAIQLYDLQHRLGLNQPSKVVDWLLNEAKHEIDQLPPLQMPPGNLAQNPMLRAFDNNNTDSDHKSQGQFKLINSGGIINWDNDPLELSTTSIYWRDHMKCKEVVGEEALAIHDDDKESWTKRMSSLDDHGDAYLFDRANDSNSNSQTGLLNNVMQPVHNSSNHRWEPSYLSLSHTEDHLHQNLSNGHAPILPASLSGSYHPPAGGDFEYDPKQMINFQMLSSTSNSQNHHPFSNSSFIPPLYTTVTQTMRPFRLSTSPNSGSAPTKDDRLIMPWFLK